MDYPTTKESLGNTLTTAKQWRNRPGETITIQMGNDFSASGNAVVDGGMTLRIPNHWQPDPAVNVHATEIESTLFDWFGMQGFGEESLATLQTFAPRYYAGMPFPRADRHELTYIAIYLSLWLLWDDEDVETVGRGFRIRPQHVFHPEQRAATNLFDHAWSSVFRELARAQSRQWIENILKTMDTWSAAALQEARRAKFPDHKRKYVTFSEAMESRIATIGMYATAYLIEYARHIELPREFHDHPKVQRIKLLSNKIVGLGNDLLSLGKDLATDYVNVVTVLADELDISLRKSIRIVARMHDEAILEFERLACSLPSFGAKNDRAIEVWLGDLRHACVGFTIWEAHAPRYAAFKLIVNDAVLEPRFVFQSIKGSISEQALAISSV